MENICAKPHLFFFTDVLLVMCQATLLFSYGGLTFLTINLFFLALHGFVVLLLQGRRAT